MWPRPFAFLARPIADPLPFFIGEWRVERTIDDLKSGDTGTFTGVVSFAPIPEGLAYREEGTLEMGAWQGPAFRSYIWELGEDGAVNVHFADGRFFHRFSLTGGDAAMVHACDPDLYRGRIAAVSEAEFKITWRIIGPRKDLDMRSLYRRFSQK